MASWLIRLRLQDDGPFWTVNRQEKMHTLHGDYDKTIQL